MLVTDGADTGDTDDAADAGDRGAAASGVLASPVADGVLDRAGGAGAGDGECVGALLTGVLIVMSVKPCC